MYQCAIRSTITSHETFSIEISEFHYSLTMHQPTDVKNKYYLEVLFMPTLS